MVVEFTYCEIHWSINAYIHVMHPLLIYKTFPSLQNFLCVTSQSPPSSPMATTLLICIILN